MITKLVVALISLTTLGLATLVAVRDLVTLRLGEVTLFASRPGEIVLLGGFAVALVLLVVRLRRSGWRAGVALGALLLVATIACARMLPRRPATVPVADAPARADERRTLLVAVDALSWNRLMPLVRAGRLPHFAELMERGAYGVLHSERTWRPSVEKEGYWSPVVWTTIATGRTADEHGVVDFSIRNRRGKLRPASTWHRKVPAFWNLFSAFGRRVGVVGWWVSWPAEEIEGILVSSNLGLRGHRGIRQIDLDDKAWLRKRRRLTHPESYKHVVADRVGLPTGIEEFVDRELFPIDRYPIRDGSDRETLMSVLWQDRLYLDVALHLLANEELELVTTYFEGIDLVGHQFWEFMAFPERFREQARFRVPEGFDLHARVVDRYYEIVDGYLAELVTAAGDGATVIVVSDHGFGTDPEHVRGGDHTPYGAVLLAGPGIRRGTDLNLTLTGSATSLVAGPVSVLDVLPTLLYLHDLPVADSLDGRPLYRALEPRYLEAHPEVRVAGYGDFESTRQVAIPEAEEEEYLQRLRSLGYIE